MRPARDVHPDRRLPFGRPLPAPADGLPRRELVRLCAFASLGILCGTSALCAAPRPTAALPIILGSLASLSTAPLHLFPSVGVAVARIGGSIALLSTRCTHLGCPLRAVGRELVCPCHDGRYSIDGSVVSGPPPAPLPFLQGGLDSRRQVYVFPSRLDPHRRLIPV